MQSLEPFKTTACIATAGFLSLAETVAQDLTQIPNVGTIPKLISDFGLPVTFLVVVCYALATKDKALHNSEAGRLRDRDEFMAQIREDSQRSEASRASLKEAFDRQASNFEKQADAFDRLVDKIDRIRQ